MRPFDFRPVKGQLRLEWQYLLQCRYDEQRSRIEEDYFNRTVSFLGRSDAASTLDRPTGRWLDDFYASTGWRNRQHYIDALWTRADNSQRDRIIDLRGTTRPNATSALRSGERASDASLLTRLEVTQQRLRQVTTDNAVLRAQLENVLGALRAERQGLSHRASQPDQ